MATEVLGTYTPEEVTVVISGEFGVHTVTGFADGTFINISRITPASELYVGSDLTAFRVKRRNKAANIGITLHQAAASNTVMQDIQAADEEDSGNTYVFSILVKDSSGMSRFFARQAFIATVPDVGFSSTAENRDWAIQAVSMVMNLGGNTKLSPADVAVIEAMGGEVEAAWRL